MSAPSRPFPDACQSSIPALLLGKPELPGWQTQPAHEGIAHLAIHLRSWKINKMFGVDSASLADGETDIK